MYFSVMAKYPDFTQRPIWKKGTKVILARLAERIKEIL
jgi:hypothetical protein